MICNKALKITNKDIIYAQINRDYLGNLELNLYLKFCNEERHVGNIELPIDFDLNCKWCEINEIKGLISDYLEDEEAVAKNMAGITTIIDLENENIK